MTNVASGPIRVFVSYSYDSAEHAGRVLELSNRLRKDGLDCHVDQYEFSPPEGWPRWMQNQIRDARFVLLVATEIYSRRAEGREAAGLGLGATWEGAIITQELYESGGRNEKFIPVLFVSPDIAHVPKFVSGSTRYDLGTADGYERLYRHLTNQPRAPRPELGTVRVLDPITPEPAAQSDTPQPQRDLSHLALLMSMSGNGTHIFGSESVEVADRIRVQLRVEDPKESTFLQTIRKDPGEKLGLAFGLNAVLASLQSVTQRTAKNGGEEWELTLVPEVTDYGAGFMEMSFGNFSADDVAELRAKRILLNAALPKQTSSQFTTVADETLEIAVRAFRAPLQVHASPLPDLYKDVGRDRPYFIAAAKLIATLWLKLSGTVEYVRGLDFEVMNDDQVSVQFEGQRSKRYSNVTPTVLRVEGVCDLRPSSREARRR